MEERKNESAKRSKILDIKNNFIGILNNECCKKNFDILATSLSVLIRT